VNFFCIKANAMVFDEASGLVTQSPPRGSAASPKFLTNFAQFQFAIQTVCFRKPDNQPNKVYFPYVVKGNLGPSL